MSYGYCPTCLNPGISRERRPNGDDKCVQGHVYPSTSALHRPFHPFKAFEPDPQKEQPTPDTWDRSVPEVVRALSKNSGRPVLNPNSLFFRKWAGDFGVPKIYDSDKMIHLDHDLYYLHQSDGSLAVYAHYKNDRGVSVGCMSVGFVPADQWARGL